MEDDDMEGLLARLRDEFDGVRALPAAAVTEPGESILLMGAGATRLAMRMREIRSVVRTPATTRVPGTSIALLGVASFRNSIVGLYSLAALVLDAPTTAGPWVAVTRADESIGLVFDSLEGIRHLAPDGEGPPAGTKRGLVQAAVDGVPTSVIDVSGLVEVIRTQAAARAKPVREE